MFAIIYLLTRALVTQKFVFAYIVVSNTAAYSVTIQLKDINLAAAAGIDTFVLNIAFRDSNTLIQVSNAFTALKSLTTYLKLFFTFDYLSSSKVQPAIRKNLVVSYFKKYKDSKSYF